MMEEFEYHSLLRELNGEQGYIHNRGTQKECFTPKSL
jgi:hypothetical protein